MVPEASLVSCDNVVVYQLDQTNGGIKKLKTEDGIPSDKNYLNELLAEGNHIFDQLLKLEQEILKDFPNTIVFAYLPLRKMNWSQTATGSIL